MASLLRRAMKALGMLPTTLGPIVHAIPVFSFGPRRGSREVLIAYRENGWPRAVVDTVADAVATPTWKAYKRVGFGGVKRYDARWKSAARHERRKALEEATQAGDLVELPEHEVLRLLESPHPEYPGREMHKLLQVHLDLVGETFLWLRLGQDGRPVGWEPVPPHCVHMTPRPGRPYFALSYGQFSGYVPAEHMLWPKHLAPRLGPVRGLSRTSCGPPLGIR